jgi:hypothetical protein
MAAGTCPLHWFPTRSSQRTNGPSGTDSARRTTAPSSAPPMCSLLSRASNKLTREIFLHIRLALHHQHACAFSFCRSGDHLLSVQLPPEPETSELASILKSEFESDATLMVATCRYTYTAEDVQRMIEEKRAKGTSGRNSAAERARLERRRDAAMDKGDLEEAQR